MLSHVMINIYMFCLAVETRHQNHSPIYRFQIFYLGDIWYIDAIQI